MGVKLSMLGAVCASILLSISLMGCVAEMRDTVETSPPIDESSITSDQGYLALWDDGTINSNLPEALVSP